MKVLHQSLYQYLKQLPKRFTRITTKKPKPLKLTKKEQEEFDKAEFCHICSEELYDVSVKMLKVRDHCHFTGKYRGAANDSSSHIS